MMSRSEGTSGVRLQLIFTKHITYSRDVFRHIFQGAKMNENITKVF